MEESQSLRSVAGGEPRRLLGALPVVVPVRNAKPAPAFQRAPLPGEARGADREVMLPDDESGASRALATSALHDRETLPRH